MVHHLITLCTGDAWWLQQLRLDLHCGGVKGWVESRKVGERGHPCEFL